MLRLGGICSALGLFTGSAWAQQPCNLPVGPDVIVGDLQSISNYTNVGSIDAFSVGTYSCNIGNQNLLWQANSVNHPVVPQNMYRFKMVNGAGRFEQIGQSWMKHTFTALTDNICCNCNGQGGSVLGVGCADPYTSGRNGTQLSTVGGLGPRFDVNAHSGGFTWPYPFRNNNGSVAVTSITRRLQVQTSDLNPSMNAGATYYVEAQYVTPDDASARNQDNNSSYRQITISGGDPNYSATMTGSVVRMNPAIAKWQLLETGVLQKIVATPEQPNGGGDTTGTIIVASKATNVGGGIWNYEYAAYNMNSHRSAKAFIVPLPAGASANTLGFHDVFYHSGDGYNSTPTNQVTFDGTDWVGVANSTEVRWDMVPVAPYENSNALRWGTMYNFRFRSSNPPKNGFITLGLYRAVTGLPDTATGQAIVPDFDCNNNEVADSVDISSGTSSDTNLNGIPDECEGTPCPEDVNGDGNVNFDDVLAQIAAWGACAGCPEDVNGDGQVNFDDVLACIAVWGPC